MITVPKVRIGWQAAILGCAGLGTLAVTASATAATAGPVVVVIHPGSSAPAVARGTVRVCPSHPAGRDRIGRAEQRFCTANLEREHARKRGGTEPDHQGRGSRIAGHDRR